MRASAAGVGYGGCRKADGLLAGRWNANVREGDADCAQSGLSSAVKTSSASLFSPEIQRERGCTSERHAMHTRIDSLCALNHN
jgi:hypothetical protein